VAKRSSQLHLPKSVNDTKAHIIGQRIETSSLAGSYQQRAVYCECAVLDRGHKGKLNRCNGREPQGVSAMAGGDLGDDGILRLSPTFSMIAMSKYHDCCLGLMLIKFSSVAVAIIATMPPRLSAICIASPSEMSSSAMWLANASRTPTQ